MHSVDIACITETWASSNNISNAELSMDGKYSVFRQDRVERPGGGVCILCTSRLKCSAVAGIDSTCEVVAVDIFCDKDRTFRLICAYYSPTGTCSELSARMARLCSTLDMLLEVSYPVIVTGDFNSPSVNWKQGGLNCSEGSREFAFTSFCYSSGLSQLVREPTRGDNILDLLLVTDDDLVADVRVGSSPIKSDHRAIYFDICAAPPARPAVPAYDFSRADYDQMSASLAATNWHRFFSPYSSVDSLYCCLVAYVSSLIALTTPLRCSSSSPLQDFVKRATRRLLGSLEPQQKAGRVLMRAAVRLRKFEEAKLDIKNAREFFRYAQRRLNCRAGVGPLNTEEGIIVEDSGKAAALLKGFESAYRKTSVKSPVFTQQATCSLDHVSFDCALVYSKLKQLKKAVSRTPDNIPQVLFKELARELAEPLSLIFTRSFEDGEVPELFKQTIVTPVFKKGSRSLVENYRPIALSSVACLVMEKIIVDSVYKFLLTNNLLDSEQHGFTRGRSTGTQLLEVAHEFALARNRKRPLHMVYFDFSRAFDRVDHEILLQKMAALGMGPKILKWCRSYLTGRTFRVKVGETLSQHGNCTSGVPQGSCLGPLLFTMFVQDLKHVLGNSSVRYKVYADDLKIFSEVVDNDSSREIQVAIDSIVSWSLTNGMEISLKKCAVLKTVPDSTIYTLNGFALNQVNTYRDLGVTFDCELKFREHITCIAQASSRLCNMILRCFIIEDFNHYIKLYKAIVVPKLTYCIHVWSPFYKKDLTLLQRVQDRFVKRVSNRCGLEMSHVNLPSIRVYQEQADYRALRFLSRAKALDKYFVLRRNVLRSGVTVSPPEVATLNVVNNAFAWRVCRRVHSDDVQAKILLPLFQ